MRVIDRGSGPPLVLIPGLQGRWEYMRATVDALASSFRVITFSLEGSDLDAYARQVVDAMDHAAIDSAVICGVSFGGLIAVRAAARQPLRCKALVLASTPQPSLTLRRRHEIYLKMPWLFGFLFLAETPFRVRRELRAAIADPRARRRYSRNAVRTFLGAPVSLGKMAARARLAASDAIAGDCARITVPTLIVTGEAHLDYVVPVEGASEYQRLIPHARRAVLESTGHLGAMTRPHQFTALVREFVEGLRDAAA